MDMFTMFSMFLHGYMSFNTVIYPWSWKTSISYSTYLLVMDLLSFCPKYCYVAFILKDILAGYRAFGWQLPFYFYFFHHLRYVVSLSFSLNCFCSDVIALFLLSRFYH